MADLVLVNDRCANPDCLTPLVFCRVTKGGQCCNICSDSDGATHVHEE